MTTKENALYAIMEEKGYSIGLIHATLHAIGWSKEAIDDTIVFIEDNSPSEQEIIAKISEYLR